MRAYRIKNWTKFQHYKDRNPPWIKLHVEILQSQDWVMLADASRLLAVVCMIVAARNNGMVPDDPHYLRRVAYLDKLPNLKPLIDCGFLENMQADASESKQEQANARPEAEAYRTETETETTPVGVVSAPSKRATRWPSDAVIPDDWLEWGRNRRPEVDVILEAEKFVNYWPSAKNGLKMDWQKTWRNWVLNATAKANGHDKRPGEPHSFTELAARIAAEKARANL